MLGGLRVSGDPVIELEIPARKRSVGNFAVGRVLPAPVRRQVGPFVFFDHMGPVDVAPGEGMDVKPHPHIGLATVTYLFAGEVFHRDSVGSAQAITPGAINWMTAGRGIVHSERSPEAVRAKGGPVHGLQLWVALPDAVEEGDPTFAHHGAGELPELDDTGVRARVLAGTAFGVASPVAVASPLFYVDAMLPAGTRIEVPREHEERAVYVVDGEVGCGAATIGAATMAVLRPKADAMLEATVPTRLVMIGGAPLGPRWIWWNFVSSRQERIVQAAHDWRDARFPKVPGDEHEYVAMNDEPRFAHAR